MKENAHSLAVLNYLLCLTPFIWNQITNQRENYRKDKDWNITSALLTETLRDMFFICFSFWGGIIDSATQETESAKATITQAEVKGKRAEFRTWGKGAR